MDAEQQQQQAPQDGQVLAPAQGLGGIPPGPEPPGEQVDGVAAGTQQAQTHAQVVYRQVDIDQYIQDQVKATVGSLQSQWQRWPAPHFPTGNFRWFPAAASSLAPCQGCPPSPSKRFSNSLWQEVKLLGRNAADRRSGLMTR